MEYHNNGGKVKGFMIGSLLGGLIGSGITLLFAPREGKKMRRELSKKYHKLSDQAHDFYENMSDKCKHFMHIVDKKSGKPGRKKGR